VEEHHSPRGGFTLVEVMVVIVIIAVLVAILIPVLMKAKNSALQTTCISNQHQLAASILIETQNSNMYPEPQDVWQQMKIGQAALSCPAKDDHQNDYVYAMKVAGESIGFFHDPTQIVVTADGEHQPTAAQPLPNIGYEDSDAEYRHGKKCVASYLDGHCALASSVSLSPRDLYNWVTGIGVTPSADLKVTSSSNAGSSSPDKLIDGTGTAGWQSSGTANEWVQIDLGKRESVDAIRVWNYCQPGQTNCGVKSLRVYLDDTPQANGSPFITRDTEAAAIFDLSQSGANSSDSGVVKFSVRNGGRYVTLVPVGNFGGTSLGLAQVGVGVEK